MSERAIFFDALDRDDPADRAAYLAVACGTDPALRRRVEALLRSHDSAGDFLGRPAPEQLADTSAGRAGDTRRGVPPDDPAPLPFLAPSDRPGSVGRLGHYELLGVVGRGGMGVVLRAVDPALDRVVAIKALAPQLAVDDSARRRFAREARAAAAVAHDHLVAVHAVEADGPVPYLVMAFVDGPTLQEKLDRDGPLPVAEVVRIGGQIAAGLAAAHQNGLVHRDVKPANVLLEGGGRVKITDFGLARAADDARLTRSGLIAGTPEYMSPEQADGRPVDPRSDLFSLGSVLYALCAGHPPFRAETTMGVLRRVCEARPRPLREVNPAVPDWLAWLVAKLQAKDPADRFGSASEVADLLARGLAGTPPSVPGPRRRTRRLRRAGAAVLLVVAGLGLSEATGMTDLRGVSRRAAGPVEPADPPSEAEQWERAVAGLSAEEQVAEVGRRLRERNPEFRGKVESTIEDGKVIAFGFLSDRVSDISPVRALAGLRSLDCGGSDPRNGRLADLSALRGLRLERLDCSRTQVTDLEPLRGMPLKLLHVSFTRVDSLSPLEGMALSCLTMNEAPVSDLRPLRGMPLSVLDLCGTRVNDLNPLQGMPLDYLNLSRTPIGGLPALAGMTTLRTLLVDDTMVADLGPVRGLPLTKISFRGTAVDDPSPVVGMPLTDVRLDFRPEWAAALRTFGQLRIINDRPAAEFWKGVPGK